MRLVLTNSFVGLAGREWVSDLWAVPQGQRRYGSGIRK